MPGIEDCCTIELRTVFDQRGSISFMETGIDIPFEVARVYLTYDIPSGATRAAHAHRRLRQVYIAASGAFDVDLSDGRTRRKVTLNRPNQGLLVGPGIWREINNFSSNACLVALASEHFEEDEYIRDFAVFEKAVAAGEFEQTVA